MRQMVGAIYGWMRIAARQGADAIRPITKESRMSDPRRQLAELYQRVVQDELGLAATIEEDGDVLFDHPEMGGFFISLSVAADPGYMKLGLPAFFDVSGVAREVLVRSCNRVNVKGKLATLTVHEEAEGNVCASVALLLAAPGRMPDEALLRGVIGRAFSSIQSAAEELFSELENQE